MPALRNASELRRGPPLTQTSSIIVENPFLSHVTILSGKRSFRRAKEETNTPRDDEVLMCGQLVRHTFIEFFTFFIFFKCRATVAWSTFISPAISVAGVLGLASTMYFNSSLYLPIVDHVSSELRY